MTAALSIHSTGWDLDWNPFLFDSCEFTSQILAFSSGHTYNSNILPYWMVTSGDWGANFTQIDTFPVLYSTGHINHRHKFVYENYIYFVNICIDEKFNTKHYYWKGQRTRCFHPLLSLRSRSSIALVFAVASFPLAIISNHTNLSCVSSNIKTLYRFVNKLTDQNVYLSRFVIGIQVFFYLVAIGIQTIREEPFINLYHRNIDTKNLVEQKIAQWNDFDEHTS